MNREQGIRVQALRMAVDSLPVAANLEEPEIYEEVVIARAEVFEAYITDGANNA